MDWKTIHTELRKLESLVDGWAQTDEIPAVERDLALEKLRNLYETIRFAGPAPEQPAERMPGDGEEAQEEILPESIDLGEMLSMEELPDLTEPAGPIFVEPTASFAPERESASTMDAAVAGHTVDSDLTVETVAPAGPDGQSAAEPTEELAASTPTESVSEPLAASTNAEPVPEPLAEPDVEPKWGANPAPAEEARPVVSLEPNEAPAPTPAPESKPIVESEPVPVTAPAEELAPGSEPAPTAATEPIFEPEPVAVPAEELAPGSEPAPTAALTSEPESVTAPAEESVVTLDPAPSVTSDGSFAASPATAPTEASEPAKHRHASPTLFGMEDEEELRHRHKQRVIMSLYGPSPESERRSATAGRRVEDRPDTLSRRTTPSRRETNASGADVEDFELEEVTLTPGTTSVASSETPLHDHSEPRPAEQNPVIPTADDSGSPTAEAPTGEADFEPTLSEITIPRAEAAKPEDEPACESVEDVAVESPRSAGSGTQPRFAATYGPEPTSASEPLHPQGGAVLGEVINPHVQTLADTIAPPHDIASELRRNEPVTDLRQAIGLNDKFLLIRDLFGGDAQAYERAIETLNDFDDLDDCMIFIAEHYAWNPNSDGAKLMMELLERKFA